MSVRRRQKQRRAQRRWEANAGPRQLFQAWDEADYRIAEVRLLRRVAVFQCVVIVVLVAVVAMGGWR